MIKCVEREIEMRKKGYPWLVEQQHMGQGQADREIHLMQAVKATLEKNYHPTHDGNKIIYQRDVDKAAIIAAREKR